MFERNVSRRGAMRRQVDEDAADALLRVTGMYECLFAAAFLVVLAAVLAWSLAGRVEVTLTVDGVFTLPGEHRRVLSTVAGLIVGVAVEPGEEIGADTPIAMVMLGATEQRLRDLDAREAVLTDLIERSGAETHSMLATELAAARDARLALARRDETAGVIVGSLAGEITALHVSLGDDVDEGTVIADVRVDAGGATAAAAFVAEDSSRGIRAGQAVRLLIEGADGSIKTLPGEIATVSQPGERPWWLNGGAPAESGDGGPRGRLVQVAVDSVEDARFEDLRPVRLEIVLERVAPLMMFGRVRHAP